MPVELPTARRDIRAPTPPKAMLWLGVFVLVMLAGIASTLLTWPKDTPTNSPWFWLRLLVLPALGGCFLFGLRRLHFDQENARLRADDEVLAADRAQALKFAQEPLAVLGASYLCALGSADVAAKIIGGANVLASRDTRSRGSAVRHTALDVAGFTQQERFDACFEALLRPLIGTLSGIPPRVPLRVYLQLPATVQHAPLFELWERRWKTTGLRTFNATLLRPEEGVLALDTWLDARGGPELEKVALFVAVQLHDTPPANSAEAGVALLLGWPPLVERQKLTSRGLLHRPVDDANRGLNETVSNALLWGGADPAQVQHLWQAGLVREDQSSLMQATADLALGFSTDAALDGIHDIDAAIGHAGVAAAWLAIALSAEHAQQVRTPLLVASRQHTFRAMVVRSQPSAVEAELQP